MLLTNSDKWIFGYKLIKEYEMVFDYENKEITFNNEYGSNDRTICYIVIMNQLVIGICNIMII